MCIYTLFFFLCSCQSQSAWNCDTISGSETHSTLVLSTESSFKDLEIELQKSGDSTRIYLNAYGLPFTPDADGTVPVTLIISERTYHSRGMVLQGNQSIRLPPENEQMLYDALLKQEQVTVTAGRYSAKVRYDGFEEALKRFKE